MLKSKALIALLIIIILSLTGCFAPGEDTPVRNAPDINPNAEAANKDTSAVTLYFSYNAENLLAGETRLIDVPVSKTLEETVVEELIAGPSADRDELVGLFWQGVELESVDTNNDVIFIKLSEEFVESEPDDSQFILQGSSADQQKMLAIYSIVNTLTEMGKYSKVQIHVNQEGVTQGLTQAEAGVSDDENASLGSLSRNQSLILTPENTLAQALQSFEKKNYTRLYNFTAYTNPDGSQKPEMDAFSDALAAKGYELDDYNVRDSNVSFDGKSAVVTLDYSMSTREGEPLKWFNIPVILVREDDIWKLTYTSLVNILINA